MRLPHNDNNRKLIDTFWDHVARTLREWNHDQPGEMIRAFRNALSERLEQMNRQLDRIVVAGEGTVPAAQDDLVYHLSPERVAEAIVAFCERKQNTVNDVTAFKFDRRPEDPLSKLIEGDLPNADRRPDEASVDW